MNIDDEVVKYVKSEVHHQYYDYDTNFAGTTLRCLSKLFGYPIGENAWSASLGMHGAGGYRAQCGLVEGTLMFLGMYFTAKGYTREAIIQACYNYGEAYEKEFGSLRCKELRPQGFAEGQPAHMCEGLTVKSILFGPTSCDDGGRHESSLNGKRIKEGRC